MIVSFVCFFFNYLVSFVFVLLLLNALKALPAKIWIKSCNLKDVTFLTTPPIPLPLLSYPPLTAAFVSTAHASREQYCMILSDMWINQSHSFNMYVQGRVNKTSRLHIYTRTQATTYRLKPCLHVYITEHIKKCVARLFVYRPMCCNLWL